MVQTRKRKAEEIENNTAAQSSGEELRSTVSKRSRTSAQPDSDRRSTRAKSTRTRLSTDHSSSDSSKTNVADFRSSSSRTRHPLKPKPPQPKASPKKSSKKKEKLPSSTDTITVQIPIRAELNVHTHDNYDSVDIIDAYFYAGSRDEPIGEVVTYLVDKSKGRGSLGSKKATGALWMRELLTPASSSAQEAERSEVELIFQTLFTPRGGVRAPFKKHTAALSGDEILFVHTMQLEEAHRGTGAARGAMAAFLNALPKISDGWAFEGTIVLSPAIDAGDLKKKKKKNKQKGTQEVNLAEEEERLVKFWGKIGFEVWLKGDVEVEGSVTIMGREWEEEGASVD